jgi:hypothetical protein
MSNKNPRATIAQFIDARIEELNSSPDENPTLQETLVCLVAQTAARHYDINIDEDDRDLMNHVHKLGCSWFTEDDAYFVANYFGSFQDDDDQDAAFNETISRMLRTYTGVQ